MRPLFRFFALTYILSWSLWIAAAALLRWDISQRSGLIAISGPLYLLGVFAPAFVALALTAQREGRAGTMTLLRRTIRWSVGVRWYMFALGYFAAIKLAVGVVHRLTVGTWPAFTDTPWFVMLAAIVTIAPRSKAIEQLQLDKPPEALAETARSHLASFGYTAKPVDRAHGFGSRGDFARYVERNEKPEPNKWAEILGGSPLSSTTGTARARATW